MYAQQRVEPQALFRHVRHQIDSLRDTREPLVVAIDDTILRKTGRSIPNAAYRKDPLSPPFNLNLVWAQRMIQFSAAVPGDHAEVRMIPIDYRDASTPRKPRKGSSEEQWQAYREAMKQTNLNQRAIDMLHQLQNQRTVDTVPALHVLVDGSYTNRKVLKNLPPNTTLIGRIRKDARLYYLPEDQPKKGRKRLYGKQAPTPDALRRDSSVPWEILRVRTAGKDREFRVKTIAPVRWRASGDAHDLRLFVITPVPGRHTPGAKRIYRQPAYLICTDPDLPIQTVLQQYVWRWDIELNHRDEKTLLGVGQAQVRNKNSVELVPASAVATYAMLHVAAIRAYGWAGKANIIPLPKWRDPKKKKRASTLDLVNELRRQLWSRAIRPSHLSHFANNNHTLTKPQKYSPQLQSALNYRTA